MATLCCGTCNSNLSRHKQPLKRTLLSVVVAVACRGCVWKCPWHIVRTGFAFARQPTRTRTTSTWLRLMPLADLDVRHTSGLGADSAYCGVAVSLWIPTPVAALLSHEFNELLGNLLCFQHTYTIYFCVSDRVCLRVHVCVCILADAFPRNWAAFWPNRMVSCVYAWIYVYVCISFRGSSEANVSCYCCSFTWRTHISLQTVGPSVCV